MTDPGGAERNRTDDILLAKQTLYQLSYGPVCFAWWVSNKPISVSIALHADDFSLERR